MTIVLNLSIIVVWNFLIKISPNALMTLAYWKPNFLQPTINERRNEKKQINQRRTPIILPFIKWVSEKKELIDYFFVSCKLQRKVANLHNFIIGDK